MFYAGHWSGYLVVNRPSWNKGFRGSHDITIVTTLDSANDKVSAIRKSKTGNVWKDITVHQPKAIDRYNKYMNGVDRSDQIMDTNK